MEFDHIGVPAAAKRDGMRFLESKRLWLTSPRDHPYRVDSLEDAMEGEKTIAEPFDVFGEVRVSFIEVDGAPVEFVQPL